MTRGGPTLVVDWDGVIHEDPSWKPVYRNLDMSLIREAHRRGWNVAIMTCSLIPQVAASLRAEGFRVHMDTQMRCQSWDGGADGRVVLVTARKVIGKAYVDDKAVNHHYGDSVPALFEQVDRVMEETAIRKAAARGLLAPSRG